MEACFGPFSAQLAKVGPYRALEKEAQDLIGALHEKLERRRRDLQTGLVIGVRSKIKLTTVELKVYTVNNPFESYNLTHCNSIDKGFSRL